MATPPGGYDLSDPKHEEVREALKQFGRHLVCLSFFRHRVEPCPDTSKSFFHSGFIMEFGDKWYWTTAGHILEEIDRALNTPDLVLDGFRLLDHFGAGAINRNAILFDFRGAWRYFEHNDDLGLDYGAVEIREHDKRLLKANNVMPIPVREWQDLQSLKFKSHFMVGFCEDGIERIAKPIAEGVLIQGRATPSFIYVEQMEPREGEQQRPYPRFVGKLSSNWPEGSIVGMSGGPVFGFVEGEAEYRVVAVQSCWLESKRITYACPLEVVGQKLLQAIANREPLPAGRIPAIQRV